MPNRRGDSRKEPCCPKRPKTASDLCPIDALPGTSFCDAFFDPAIPQWTNVPAGCATADPDRPGKGIRLSRPAGGGSCLIVHPPPAPTLTLDGDLFCMCVTLRVADGVARPDAASPTYFVVLTGSVVGDQIVLFLPAGKTTWRVVTSVTGPPAANVVVDTAVPPDGGFHTFRFCVKGDLLTVDADGLRVLESPHDFADDDYQAVVQATASAAFASDLRLDQFCVRSA